MIAHKLALINKKEIGTYLNTIEFPNVSLTLICWQTRITYFNSLADM